MLCVVVLCVLLLLFCSFCFRVLLLICFYESQNGLGPLAVGSRRSGNRVGKKLSGEWRGKI